MYFWNIRGYAECILVCFNVFYWCKYVYVIVLSCWKMKYPIIWSYFMWSFNCYSWHLVKWITRLFCSIIYRLLFLELQLFIWDIYFMHYRQYMMKYLQWWLSPILGHCYLENSISQYRNGWIVGKHDSSSVDFLSNYNTGDYFLYLYCSGIW